MKKKKKLYVVIVFILNSNNSNTTFNKLSIISFKLNNEEKMLILILNFYSQLTTIDRFDPNR